MLPEIVKYQDVIVPIAAFLLGFFASRFTLSKDARLSHESSKFALSKEMAESQNKAYLELMHALTKYVNDKGKERSIDDFFALSGPAQNYLFQQKMVADAILANKIDKQSRNTTFVPKLVETADKIIPKVYENLKKIAERHRLPYPDHFDRANYQSIFDVVEKYGRSSPLTPPAANTPSTGGWHQRP